MEKESRIRTIRQLFTAMFVIGLFTFGGGLSMIPQMTRAICHKRQWMPEADLLDYFAVAQTLPGAVAINTAALVGYRLAGTTGAVVGLFGSVLPSFLVLVGVAAVYELLMTNVLMLGVLRGVGGAVTALLLSAAWSLRKTALKNVWQWLVCGVSLTLVLWLDVNPVWLLLGAAGLGLGITIYQMRRGEKPGSGV